MRSYRTLAAPAQAEIEVKRSRFLADVVRVDEETAARGFVAAQRKLHHDARHHCSAFVLGPSGEVQRSNDDGEPAGTAGMPILEVLRGSGLTDVAAVVTRWFGGTLLGAGGLVRAYSEAVANALENAEVTTRSELACFDLAVSHADAGRVEAQLRAHGIEVTGTSYGAEATLHLATAYPDELAELVAAATSGAGQVEPHGTRWVDLP